MPPRESRTAQTGTGSGCHRPFCPSWAGDIPHCLWLTPLLLVSTHTVFGAERKPQSLYKSRRFEERQSCHVKWLSLAQMYMVASVCVIWNAPESALSGSWGCLRDEENPAGWPLIPFLWLVYSCSRSFPQNPSGAVVVVKMYVCTCALVWCVKTNCMLCLHASSWFSEQATCQERRGWILLQSGLTPAEASCWWVARMQPPAEARPRCPESDVALARSPRHLT